MRIRKNFLEEVTFEPKPKSREEDTGAELRKPRSGLEWAQGHGDEGGQLEKGQGNSGHMMNF